MNLLVLFCDQLRRQALSCYGDPNIQTPHIDALARRGVRFEAACSTYPICVPFRFSLMTGEYAHRYNVPGINYRLDPAGHRMLADPFNEAGYHTAYIGKWHLADTGGCETKPQVPPHLQGRWQKWLGFEVRNSHFDTWITEDADPTPRKLDGYQTDQLFDLTMAHLRDGRPKDRPFFAICSVEPPHFPYEAPPELEAKWAGRDLILPPTFMQVPDYPVHGGDGWDHPNQRTREARLKNLRTYYAMIENLDHNVGRMTRFLEDEGLADDTIVVFLSDHGEMGGMHDINTAAKYYPYEESIGIPLIIADPRHAATHGQTCPEPTCTEDLFPTLCGLVGLPTGKNLHGCDLTPLTTDPTCALDRDGILLEYIRDDRPSAQYYGYNHRGLRDRRYKYVVRNGAPWMCFDLQNDPLEQRNLLHHDPTNKALFAHYHDRLRNRLITTADPYSLSPAWNRPGHIPG